MKLHKIALTGYCAKSTEWPALYLGTAGSYGNEQLAVTLGKGWEGLTVTATFQPAGVTVLVPADGTLDVPWEATETALDAAKGRIVFEGVTDGRVLISTDIPYAVGSHSDTEGSNSQPPTPSQWEQYVDEVKGNANRAEQAAKDAEAALQDVKDTGAQAVTDIGAAKNSALDAIAKAGEEAAGSITADMQAAKDAAAAAAQSAKDAAAELPKVQQAGQTVIGQITQTGATQVGAVQSAGTTQVGLVNSAGQQQAENIAQAGSQQVQAVQTAGNTAVGSVNTARDNALDALEEVAAHTPVPNPDTGKWQVWDAETGQYEDTTVSAEGPQGPQGNPGPAGQDGAPGVTPQLTIGTVTTIEPGEQARVTITGTAEAPVLNFWIPGTASPPVTTVTETATGNPAYCLNSVSAKLKGLKVFGISTQDGTPSPENPVPIVRVGDSGSITLTFSDGGEQSQTLSFDMPDGILSVKVNSGGNFTDNTGQQWICNVRDYEQGVDMHNAFIVYWKNLSWTVIEDFFHTTSAPYPNDSIPLSDWNQMSPYFVQANPYGDPSDNIFWMFETEICCRASQFTTIENFLTWLDTNNVYSIAQLETPYNTTIPGQDMLAYNNLRTYDGITIVSVDDELASLEVKYSMNSEAAIKATRGVIDTPLRM